MAEEEPATSAAPERVKPATPTRDMRDQLIILVRYFAGLHTSGEGVDLHANDAGLQEALGSKGNWEYTRTVLDVALHAGLLIAVERKRMLGSLRGSEYTTVLRLSARGWELADPRSSPWYTKGATWAISAGTAITCTVLGGILMWQLAPHLNPAFQAPTQPNAPTPAPAASTNDPLPAPVATPSLPHP